MPQKEKEKEKDISLEVSRILQPEKYAEFQIPNDPFKLAKQAASMKIVGESELIEQLLHVGLSAYTNNPLNLAILGPPSEGKCVKKGSLVSTKDGLYKIEDLMTVRTQLLSVNGSNQCVYLEPSHTWAMGLSDVLKIKFGCNYEITVTPEHPLMIYEEGKFAWRKAEHLKTGDLVMAVWDGSFAENYYTFTEEERKIRITPNMRNIPLPTICSEKFARFLGYLHSEGSVTKNSHRIDFTNTSEELLNDYQDCVQEILGLTCSRTKHEKRVPTIIFHSTKIAGFLEKIGALPQHKTYTFEIPPCILRSPKTVVTEYLRAYFAGDGGIDRKRIEIASTSLRFIQQMQTLLFSKFGIISYRGIRYRPVLNKAPLGRLFIRDPLSLMRFINEIGFIDPYHKNRANKLLKQMLNADRHYKNPLPLTNIYLFPIEEITQGKDEVYDVTMPETHNFIANGLVSHNTHSALNVMRLFPEEDVLTYAGASPKAFIHDVGVLVNSKFQPIQSEIDDINKQIEEVKRTRKNRKRGDDTSEYDASEYELRKQRDELLKGSKTLIDFENKILLLLDAPPKDLWDNLKTLLSHDKYHLEWKFVNTDRTLKTDTVVFQGFPALIVASARDESKWDIWPEIKTRVMVTNTNMDPDKYKHVFKLIAKQHMQPWKYLGKGNEENKAELEVQRIIRALRDILISERTRLRVYGYRHDAKDEELVIIPFGDLVADHYKVDKGARQREIKQFLQIIAMNALWNLKRRSFISHEGQDAGDVLGEEYRGQQTKMRFVIAEPEDYFAAERIFHSQGIAGFKLDFYRRVFYPCFLENKDGVSVSELRNHYKKITTKRITGEEVNNVYLRELEKEGFIDDIGARPEVHKQKHWYKPLVAVHSKTLDNSFEKPLFDSITVDFRSVLTEEAYSGLIKPLVESSPIETYIGEHVQIEKESVHDHDHELVPTNGSISSKQPSSPSNGSEETGSEHVNGFSDSNSPENGGDAKCSTSKVGFPLMVGSAEDHAPLADQSPEKPVVQPNNGFSTSDHSETGPTVTNGSTSDMGDQSNSQSPLPEQGKETVSRGSANGFLRRSVKPVDVVSKPKNPEVERLEKLSKLAKRYKSAEMLRLGIMAQTGVSEEQADADIQLLRSSGVVEY